MFFRAVAEADMPWLIVDSARQEQDAGIADDFLAKAQDFLFWV